MTFVDGSVYTGAFAAGKPCGFGNYSSCHGAGLRGYFNRFGVLHGPGIAAAPDSPAHIMAGEFRNGALWGRGVEYHKETGR